MSAERDHAARLKLADALAGGAAVADAARATGWRRTSAYRLIRDPEFQALVTARREALANEPRPAETVERIDRLESLALDTLEAEAKKGENGTVRVSAAAKILAWTSARKAPKRGPQQAPAPPPLLKFKPDDEAADRYMQENQA